MKTHSLQCHQKNLTSPLSKEIRSTDVSKRQVALNNAVALASVKEADKAIKELSSVLPEHRALISSIRGPLNLALNALEPVLAKSLVDVKNQKDFMRKKATADISELPVKEPLISEDPWSLSLFASSSENMIIDSMKSPALRQISVKKNFTKKGGLVFKGNVKDFKLSKQLKVDKSSVKEVVRAGTSGSNWNSGNYGKFSKLHSQPCKKFVPKAALMNQSDSPMEEENDFSQENQPPNDRLFRGRGRGPTRANFCSSRRGHRGQSSRGHSQH